MSVLDTLRDLGGCTGGITIYQAAKRSAQVRNVFRKARKLKPETICRLSDLFPGLDLSRVRIYINASLPANWFTSADDVYGMTFGYKIYFKGSGYQKSEEGLQKLMHELVHVDQVRRRGDSETQFACDYGEGYLAAGSYEVNPLEIEAYGFVNNHPVPPPCVDDPETGSWSKIAHYVYVRGDNGDLLQWTWTTQNLWQLANLSARVGGQKITDVPSSYSSGGAQYVYVRGDNGDLLQWTWTTQNLWRLANLSTRVGGQKIADKPHSYAWGLA